MVFGHLLLSPNKLTKGVCTPDKTLRIATGCMKLKSINALLKESSEVFMETRKKTRVTEYVLKV